MDDIQQIMGKLDRVLENQAVLSREVGELKVHVLGQNGGGLAGRVQALEKHTLECPTMDAVDEHIEDHKNNKYGWRDGLVILSVMGLYIKLLLDNIVEKH